MHRVLCILSLALGLCAAGTSATAAKFEFGGDESLNCRMTISGQIVRGDAEKFRSFLAEFVESNIQADGGTGHLYQTKYGHLDHGLIRICLDSPGGLVSEAVKMGDILAYGHTVRSQIAPSTSDPGRARYIIRGIGTAVSSGAICESACAIFFMAGGIFMQDGGTTNIRDPDRVLHVKGKLGFHAPSLRVEEKKYTANVVASAFDTAIESLALVSARLDRYAFSPSLFARLASTPPTSMFYIDTVEKAASWEIQLAGVPAIQSPNADHIQRMCNNMLSLSSTEVEGASQYTKEAIPESIRDDSFAFWEQEYLGQNPTFNNRYESLYEAEVLGNSIVFDGSDCGVTYDTKTGKTEFRWFRSGRDHGLEPLSEPVRYSWALYPGYVTLEELSELADQYLSTGVPGDVLLREIGDELAGTCTLFGANDDLLGRADCEATYFTRLKVDRTAYSARLFVNWSPELRHIRNVGTINYRYVDGPDACMTDQNTGMRFCFEMKYVLRNLVSWFSR